LEAGSCTSTTPIAFQRKRRAYRAIDTRKATRRAQTDNLPFSPFPALIWAQLISHTNGQWP